MTVQTQHPTDTNGNAVAEYLSRFPYHINVRAGPVYDSKFKEFNSWCEATLGSKFNDWFLLGTSKTTYRLHLRDSKKAMFLSLKYSDIIDSSSL